MEGGRPVPVGLLERRAVWVAGDRGWQRRLRLGQALWREAKGLPIGEHRGRPLGSRLAMPEAEQHGWNFLTPGVADLVAGELAAVEAGSSKVLARRRLYEDLLSSQPLAFNLFGELATDLALATRVLGELWPTRVDEVTHVEFEYSPDRGDPRYTGTRSAFDVFVEHTRPGGGTGFVGIEVKYHEHLGVAAAGNTARIEQVAAEAGIFRAEALPWLRRPPLQQLWFDHLLALSMRHADPHRWQDGVFVIAYPEANPRCAAVTDDYLACLTDRSTVERRTLEEIVAALTRHTTADWVAQFADRYLNSSRVDTAITQAEQDTA